MIVLDTHVWLWLTSDPKRLSPRARRAIDAAEQVGVCSISCWEVATLVRRGKIALDRDVGLWIRQALAQDRLEALALSADVATAAGSIDAAFAGDPADRIIYATSRSTGSLLVTKDASLRAYDRERTVW